LQKWKKGDFIGRDALAKARLSGPTRTLVGLEMIERGHRARRLLLLQRRRARVVGIVTSGSPSPTLGKNIALAYLPPALSAMGTTILVEIRSQKAKAQVVPTPFYKRTRKAANF